MPSPAFRSATSNNTGSFNDFPVAKPAGVVNGDLLLVCLATYDQNGTMAHGTPPAGWTLVRALNETVTHTRTSVYRKIAASEGSSWNFTKTNDALGFGGVICCIAVSDPGTPSAPLADEDGAIDTGGDLGVTAPSVDAGSAGDLLVYFASNCQSATASYTPPSGYTERVDLHQSGQDVHLTAATKAAGAAGATGAVTGTRNGGTANAAGFLVAVADLVVTPPVANFTATPLAGAGPLNVAFTDTSTNTPTSWAWAFGDGATSTSQNPSHSYAHSGTYTVTLTATNAAGSDGETKTGYVVVDIVGVRIYTSSGWKTLT